MIHRAINERIILTRIKILQKLLLLNRPIMRHLSKGRIIASRKEDFRQDQGLSTKQDLAEELVNLLIRDMVIIPPHIKTINTPLTLTTALFSNLDW